MSNDNQRRDCINVTDHGFSGDGTGGDLAAFLADNAHLERPFYLPEGTYRYERELRFTGGDGAYSEPIPDRFEIFGEPGTRLLVDNHDNATAKPSLFWFGTSRNPMPVVRLENLDIDIGDGDPERDAGVFRAYIGDRMETRNISLTKRCRLSADGSRNGDRHTYLTNCVNRSATAKHENIDLTAGDTHRPGQESVGHAIGFAGEPTNSGTVRYVNCKIAGYTDNGFYVRDGVGSNVLEGCFARNCGGGHIRLGKHDEARNCRIRVDGKEEPANGAGLWLQDSLGTTAKGIRIEGPAMANDAVRITHDQRGGAVRDLYLELGSVGQYALKASGSQAAGRVSLENWTVDDRCTGRTREASYAVNLDGLTFEGLTHRAHGGRIPFAFRAPGATVRESDIDLNDCRLARLGSLLETGEIADVVFDRCEIRDVGDGRSWELFTPYESPKLVRLVLESCDVSGVAGLLKGAELSAFDRARVTECGGVDPAPGDAGGYGGVSGQYSVQIDGDMDIQ